MLKFRPDIAGLRGVAVMLVLLAHASVPGFSGGFIGVDVFFVISGFLITGLLLEEHARTGRIDFANFYARRIKRLTGAVLAMLVLVSIACALIVPMAMQPDQAVAAFWASTWTSNMHFAFTGAGYFDAAVKGNAFLHSWSLGVEEQFYLAWPLFVLWACRGGGRWRIPALITLATLLSFAICLLVARDQADLAYYLTPTRLWQLSIGGLAWVLRARVRSVALAGLALVIASLALISEATPYPSWWTLLPTLGAAAVLASTLPGTLAARLLAARPLQWLGQISYSLYLWHWPILVLGSLLVLGPSLGLRMGMLVVAIAIAAASERWIERPLRLSARPPWKVIQAGLLATALVAAALWIWRGQATTAVQIAQLSSASDPVERFVRTSVATPEPYRTAGFDDYYASDRLMPLVVFKPESGPPARRVVLAGDSIVMQWEPAFRLLAQKYGWELVAVTKSGCPMVDVPFVNGRIKRRYVECERWRDRLRDYLGQYRPDLTITGSAAGYEFTSDQWEEGGRRVIDWVASASGEVLIIAPPPSLPFEGAACVRLHGRLVDGLVTAPRCAVSIGRAQHLDLLDHLQATARSKPNVRVLILDDLVCPNRTCSAISVGMLAYRDTQHLNVGFVESLAPQVAQAMGPGPRAH